MLLFLFYLQQKTIPRYILSFGLGKIWTFIMFFKILTVSFVFALLIFLTRDYKLKEIILITVNPNYIGSINLVVIKRQIYLYNKLLLCATNQDLRRSKLYRIKVNSKKDFMLTKSVEKKKNFMLTKKEDFMNKCEKMYWIWNLKWFNFTEFLDDFRCLSEQGLILLNNSKISSKTMKFDFFLFL